MIIIWFLLIGLLVAYLARVSMYPHTRFYEPWGVFLTAITASLVFGLLIPAEEIFLAPFVFIGSLMLAFSGATLITWFVGLFLALLLPDKAGK